MTKSNTISKPQNINEIRIQSNSEFDAISPFNPKGAIPYSRINPLVDALKESQLESMSCIKPITSYAGDDEDWFDDYFFENEILPDILKAFGVSLDEVNESVTVGSLSSSKDAVSSPLPHPSKHSTLQFNLKREVLLRSINN